MKRKCMNIAAVSAMMLTACGNSVQKADSGSVVTVAADENTAAEPEQIQTETETESVCAYEWKDATYIEPKTCTLCGETEREPKQTYFEEHDVQVLDAPVDCTVDGVIFNWDNPEIQKVSDVKWEQLDCYSEPAEEEGYQIVHVELKMSAQAYYDSSNDLEYNYSQCSKGVFDWYTGRNFPGRGITDTDGYEYASSLEIDGETFDISYTFSAKADSGEWTAVSDGSGDEYCDIVSYDTYIFKVPEGYDGLVFAAEPNREYNENATITIDESEYYAKECLEDTAFFRINKKGLAPLRQREV